MPENTLPATAGETLSGGIDAKVGNEVKDFGMALGDLVKHVGNAVAEAQRQLNATSAETASKLAETKVKIVAVRERHYDDDGNPVALDGSDDGESVGLHYMELPLVNFVDPVFYRWNRVRLQGQFQATEWKGSTSSETEASRYGGSVSLFVGSPVASAAGSLLGQAGALGSLAKGALGEAGGLGGNAQASLYYNNSSTQIGSSSASDVSYGQMRMNAELTPVADIGVPKPTQVFVSPRIGVTAQDITDNGSVRTVEVLLEYVRPLRKDERAADGTREKTYLPVADKAIVIEAPGLTWTFADSEKKVTDTAGQLRIRLSRELPVKDPANLTLGLDRSPKSFVLTARVGLVRNDTTVTF